MAKDSSLLVHECTNAWISEQIQKGEKGKKVRTGELDESLVEQVIARGGMKELAEPSLTEMVRNTAERGDGLTEKELQAKKVVESKARSRGHSTPDMTGGFARDIQARRLAMNHFSVM
jgi:ribonuclease Z